MGAEVEGGDVTTVSKVEGQDDESKKAKDMWTMLWPAAQEDPGPLLVTLAGCLSSLVA